MSDPMATLVKSRVMSAARNLGVADPLPYVGGLIDRSFPHPPGDSRYAANTLTPGAVPVEPSFSEVEPQILRFTMEPVGVGESPISRRDEATREMRRLIRPVLGNGALHWFDGRSEEWRGSATPSRLNYGAWIGTSYDADGLHGTEISYELTPGQIAALSPPLAALTRIACGAMPNLHPRFTSIACRRETGSQRVTFVHFGPLRLADLGPLMSQLGMGHQLPSLMQITGLVLGGRFDLPERGFLLGLGETPEGPELKLEILLPLLPDVPPSFLNLLALGLSERPRELRALGRWMRALTPEAHEWPGEFSVLSVRTTPRTSARVAVYLRPAEFEIKRRLSDVPSLNDMASV